MSDVLALPEATSVLGTVWQDESKAINVYFLNGGHSC